MHLNKMNESILQMDQLILASQLYSLPESTMLKVLKAAIDQNPDNKSSVLLPYINSQYNSVISSAILASGSVCAFGLMNTRNWIFLIHNMGYNPVFNTFERPVNVIGFEWRPDMVNYIMSMVNERQYTSRVHDLLDIQNSDTLPQCRIIATRLLQNLIDMQILKKKEIFFMEELSVSDI